MSGVGTGGGSSLVRYNNPVLVNTTKEKASSKKGGKDKLASVEIGGGKELTHTEDILNSILPPKCVARFSFGLGHACSMGLARTIEFDEEVRSPTAQACSLVTRRAY